MGGEGENMFIIVGLIEDAKAGGRGKEKGRE
jgi:hypothetical protein